MSRRSSSEKRNLHVVLGVRMTWEDLALLRAHAARKGMTAPEFVRGLVKAAIAPVPRDES